MSQSRAASRYAKAILEIAQTKGVAQAVNQDMVNIYQVIVSNAELNTFIENPTIKANLKSNALVEIFQDSNEVTHKLFRLLNENKRFEILSAITSEYKKLYDISNNVEVAFVTTATEIDSVLEEKIMAKISQFSSSKITIKNTIDPSIIGGFILRIGDKQYNASVANRLQVLKRELSN